MMLPVGSGLLACAAPCCRGRAAAKAYLMPNDIVRDIPGDPCPARAGMSYSSIRKQLVPSGLSPLKKEKKKGRNTEVLPAGEERPAGCNLPALRGVLAQKPPCPPSQHNLPLSNEAGEGWMTAASQRARDD